MELIISLIVGISLALIMFILMYEPPSSIKKRLKKNNVKKDSESNSIMKNLQEIIEPLSRKSTNTKNYINKTKKLLLQAGEASSEDDVIKYETKKIATVILTTIGCMVWMLAAFSTLALLGCIVAIYYMYKAPEFKLQRKIKIRQKEFMKFLPDAIDLLSICVKAGLGLDASFSRVAEEFTLTSPTVAVEFDRLNKDILSGISRQDAYKNLVLRNENQELQSFVALLIQSDKLGTSISQSLEPFVIH